MRIISLKQTIIIERKHYTTKEIIIERKHYKNYITKEIIIENKTLYNKTKQTQLVDSTFRRREDFFFVRSLLLSVRLEAESPVTK